MIDIFGWIKGWHLERVFPFLRDAAQKVWDKINPEVQNILIQSSKVVEVIKKGQGQTPQFIKDKIHELLPFYTEAKLDEILKKTANALNIATESSTPDVLQLIVNIGKKLEESNPTELEGVAQTIASFIGLFSTPNETTFEVIASIMKFMFTTFVKDQVTV